MSSFDDWLDKRTAVSPALEDELRPKPKPSGGFDEWLNKKVAFPPPPPGSIPQADVFPGEKSAPLAGRVVKEEADRLGRVTLGAIGGGPQMLRHPINTAAAIIGSNVAGTMDLAEMALPGVHDKEFPLHKTATAVEEWGRRGLAADALTPETAQFASGISPYHDIRWGYPDLVGIKLPLAGVTKLGEIPAVAKAGKFLAPVGKAISSPVVAGMKKVGLEMTKRVPALERLAKTGREVMTARKLEPKLRIVDAYMNVPIAGKALPYIDNPASAPTDVLKQVAKDLQEIRQIDMANWDDLSYRSRKILAQLTNFKGSVVPALRERANELGLIPSKRAAAKAGVPFLEETTPFTTKAPAGGLAKTQTDVLAEKLRANPTLKATHIENLVNAVYDRVIRYPFLKAAEFSFRRPGTKMSLAARYVDQPVKRFLKGAVPRWVEAGDAEHKALSMETDFWVGDVMKAIVKHAGGDPAKYDELLNDALSHLNTSKRVLKTTGAAPKGQGISIAEDVLAKAQKSGDPKAVRTAEWMVEKAKAYEAFRQRRAALRKAGVKEKDLPRWSDPIPMAKPRPPTAVPEGEVSPEEMADLFADYDPGIPAQQAAPASSVIDELDAAASRLSGSLDTSQVKLAQEVEAARSAERLAAGEARLPPPPGPSRRLPQELIDVLDDVKGKWRGRIEDSARWGYFDQKTLARLRDPNELLLNVYRAAHNPKWINEAKQLDAWDNVREVLRGENPNARSGQINAAIKQLLNIEVAQEFERSGWRAIAGNSRLKENPILARVLNDRTLRDVLGEEMEHLFGKVTDIKTAMELSGETLARHRSKLFMNQGLADDMHRMGLMFSSPSEQEGFANVAAYMGRTGEKLWVPAAMEDVFKTGENLYRDMTMAYRAYLKTGALWRAGSTAYSPTNIAVGAISNISSGANSGDMFRVQFLPALRTAWKQTRGMMGSSEKIFGKLSEEQRAFEIANARMGLGAGTASGEMGSMLTELGATPRLGSTQKIPRVLEKVGVSPTNKVVRKTVSAKNRAGKFMRDAFQRSDVLFKQTIAQLITADFDAIAKHATPNDVKNIMEGLYGSKEPVVIAANYTADVSQTYSRVSPLFRFLGRGPLAGLFGSFPYESTRNFGHGVNYTIKALRGAATAESPVVKQILMGRAMRHIAGLSMNMRFLGEMSKIAEETVGPRLSERKRKALHEVALPKYDRSGPTAILKRDHKGNVFYSALQNLEYMQTPNKIINNLGTIASHLTSGPWNQLDEDLAKTAVNLTDDFLQWQQPTKGIAEFLMNQRIQPSIGSMLEEGSERRGVTRLSVNPIKSENYAERAKKALLPAVLPTPLRQAFDLGEYAMAPEADTESGRSPREISPVRIKDVNTLDEMGKAGFSFGERKNGYSRALDDIMKAPISNKEKADRVMDLRDDWQDDLGAEMARQLPHWLALHTYDEVLEAMKTVGHETAEPAMAGQVPNFMWVFEDKIPPHILMRMRRRR